MDDKFKEPRKNREDFETEEEYMTWWKGHYEKLRAFTDAWVEEGRKQAQEAESLDFPISGAPFRVESLESIMGFTVEVLPSGERYVQIPLERFWFLMKKTGMPITFKTTPSKSLDHGSYKDLIDSETATWLDESSSVPYVPVEEIQFRTADDLLTWVFENRDVELSKVSPFEGCLPSDDPKNRTLGFSIPGKHAFITLTDIRLFPASVEVLKKFSPIPEEILKDMKENSYDLMGSYAGRIWLASGVVLDATVGEELPDSTPLDEIWAAEAEQSKMMDEGDLGIPRPSKDR